MLLIASLVLAIVPLLGIAYIFAQGSFDTVDNLFYTLILLAMSGVMAKQAIGIYESNKRTMLKVKHERECDCVVAGFRWHKRGERSAVGSLLLGLYDGAGALQHIGVCASFTDKKRRELVEFLAPYRENALVDHP